MALWNFLLLSHQHSFQLGMAFDVTLHLPLLEGKTWSPIFPVQTPERPEIPPLTKIIGCIHGIDLPAAPPCPRHHTIPTGPAPLEGGDQLVSTSKASFRRANIQIYGYLVIQTEGVVELAEKCDHPDPFGCFVQFMYTGDYFL
ncbi:hypothetical protein BJ508DRAFT_307333 [Ascobolus immersus RN42]|uniref:Uncharacterized protein n=1 Tax=Ascobolus immersus RN42 TaxID=1160509 RepID=A0A3N4I4X8_ASCIM|nr:hypothetical protein BJ508DRAFT_307333 [Ascobolus immersus RN42]